MTMKRFVHKFLSVLFIVITVTLSTNVLPVGAISQQQRDVFGEGIFYFDTEVAVENCGQSSTSLTGSENAEKIYNYFIAKGLSPIQTAGFMGNMQAESGFDPGIQEGKPISGRGGFGIVQWTGGRRVALEAAAAAKNISVSDLGFQLDFMWSELEGPYKTSVLEPLKATGLLLEATKIVLYNFEIPANKESKLVSRNLLSLGILAKYGSGGAPASITGAGLTAGACGGTGTTGGGIVTSGYSLPVDERFYVEHKEWFTKDHHLTRSGGQNPASDIPVGMNTLIYSITDGTITDAPNEGGYGQGVTIDAGNGVILIYGHGTDGGSFPGAKKGDVVKAGQPIMHSGNTGKSTGPHLHVGIKVDGTARCPQSLFVGIYEKNVPNIKSLPSSGCSGGEKI